MSKTTPEEACRLAEKHDVWMYNSNWKALAALIDEARGVDAEPVGFRVRHLYPQGPGPWRFLDKGIAHAQEGEELQLLYTHPAPSQPAAPVELPVVAWALTFDGVLHDRWISCDSKAGAEGMRDNYIDRTAPCNLPVIGIVELVKLSDAQAAIAVGRKV